MATHYDQEFKIEALGLHLSQAQVQKNPGIKNVSGITLAPSVSWRPINVGLFKDLRNRANLYGMVFRVLEPWRSLVGKVNRSKEKWDRIQKK